MTEEQLCAEYDAFLDRTGLPKYSADEVLEEVRQRIFDSPDNEQELRDWFDYLCRFIDRWNDMEEAESDAAGEDGPGRVGRH